MDIASDGLVDPTSSYVPVEALELFQRVGSLVVALASTLFCFLFLRKFVFYLAWRSFRDSAYVLGTHQWRPGNVAGPHWCNICESIVYGIRSYVVTCDICGMFAHAQCAARTPKPRASIGISSGSGGNLDATTTGDSVSSEGIAMTTTTGHAGDDGNRCACKVAAITLATATASASNTSTSAVVAPPRQQHMWIKGNIDPMDTCSICGLFCGSILALSGLKCAWCHMRVHEKCFQAHAREQQHREKQHRQRRARARARTRLASLDNGEQSKSRPRSLTDEQSPSRSFKEVVTTTATAVSQRQHHQHQHQHHHHHHRHSQHHHQVSQMLRSCDFGRHAKLILPPSAVIVNEAVATYSSKSQRAFSTVRSAAQIAVNTMSSIRLRRRSGSISSPSALATLTLTPAVGDNASLASTTSSSSSLSGSPLHGSPLASVDDKYLGEEVEMSAAPPLMKEEEIDVMPPAPLLTTTASTASTNSTTTTTTNEMLPYEIVAPKELTPLLVFINSRSGGQLGLHVLRQIRRWLNPIQIYDLSHQSPIAPLMQFKDIPRLRILVCGGDGTVGWVLSALDEIGADRQPPIAILPLGTGNDLARVLGWGSGFSAKDVSDILSEVEAAHVSLLDRWRVEMDGQPRHVLNNYMGIGVDAQVALEFHEQRERSPGLFMSQFVNKLWYSQFGAKNFLVRTCAGLPTKISLECDGEVVELPEGTEGVILLNINSYGGGSKLWHDDSDSDSDSDDSDGEEEDDEDDEDDEEVASDSSESSSDNENDEVDGAGDEAESREDPLSSTETDDGSLSDGTGGDRGSTSSSLSEGSGVGSLRRGRSGSMRRRRRRVGASSPHDGLLDVVAVYGTLHLGQMQVGLSKAVRLCQASHVKIRLSERLPMQIDGEPWMQPPSEVEITSHKQAFMLSRTVQERDFVTRRVGEVLDWAEHTALINSRQRDTLLAEISRRVADDETTRSSLLSGPTWRRSSLTGDTL